MKSLHTTEQDVRDFSADSIRLWVDGKTDLTKDTLIRAPLNVSSAVLTVNMAYFGYTANTESTFC